MPMPEPEPLDASWSAHLSTLFRGMPFEERTAAAAAAGFRTVETWWPGAELGEWKNAVRRHGLGVACFNADAGDLAAGERGFINDPSRRQWMVDSVESALQVAAELGAGVINLLPGRRVEGVGERAEWSTAVELLRECGERAGEAGVTLVVEHLNPSETPGSFLPEPASAVRLVDEVGSDNVRVLLDAYQVAMVHLDPVSEAVGAAEVVAHAHFSCVPGRREPGEGSELLARFSAALRGAGYRGAIGLEVIPSSSTAAALAALRRSIASC